MGCRRPAAAAELLRVTRTGDGGLAVGRSLPGRGAWLHPDPTCLDVAVRRRAFSRALRAPVRDGAADVVRVAIGS
ncbi:MAG TPA: YlxR family protein [Iamia sp.]|nr:YlxR family protein [Iamia sp.]